MIIGVSITKSIANFRGQTEQFSNVYHYDTAIGFTSEQLIDAIVAVERASIFPPGVTFVEAKAWGPTDQGIEQSEMLFQKNLAGFGQATLGGGTIKDIYKELAVVVNWPTGRKDSRGNPIFLRKYYHPTKIQSNLSVELGSDPMAATSIAYWKAIANDLKNLGPGPEGDANLCNEFGDGLPLGTDAQVLPYLHIRQFRG